MALRKRPGTEHAPVATAMAEPTAAAHAAPEPAALVPPPAATVPAMATATPAETPSPTPPGSNVLAEQLDHMKKAEALVREQLAGQHGVRPEALAPVSVDQHIDGMPISVHKKQFLRAHPELLDSARSHAFAFHYARALHDGIADDSEEMNQAILRGVHGEAQREQINKTLAAALEPPPAPPRRNSLPMTAPVSRSVPSLSTGRSTPTRVTLNPEEREAARLSGVSETVYAAGKLRLQQAKREGRYQEPN